MTFILSLVAPTAPSARKNPRKTSQATFFGCFCSLPCLAHFVVESNLKTKKVKKMRGFFGRLALRTVESVCNFVCPLFGGGVTPRGVDANCSMTGNDREWFGLLGNVNFYFVDVVAITPLRNTTFFFRSVFGCVGFVFGVGWLNLYLKTIETRFKSFFLSV